MQIIANASVRVVIRKPGKFILKVCRYCSFSYEPSSNSNSSINLLLKSHLKFRPAAK